MTIDFNQIIPQLTPDIQIETDWSGASAGLPVDAKKVLFLANSLSTGTIPVPTGTATSEVKRITSETKAIEWWGKGSNLAVMARHGLKVSPKVKLYGVAYKQGASASSASAEIAVTGPATGSGELWLWIDGEFFRTGISSGNTADNIVDAMVAEVIGHPNCQIAASKTTGPKLKVEVRNPGTSGNSVQFKLWCTRGVGVSFQTPAMTAAGTESSGEPLANGTVDGDPSIQLAALENQRFHLIVLDTSDSTALAAIKTHLQKLGGPAFQKWGMGIGGCNGTSATVQTLANAQDAYRVQVFWLEKAPQHPAILAAIFGATRGLYGCTSSCIDKELIGMAQPFSPTDWPGPTDIEEALEEGIVPGRCSDLGGRVEIARSVTTRQTVPLAFRDHCIQEKSDYFDETIIKEFSAYKGRTLKTASPPGSPSTLTPDRLTVILNRAIGKLDKADVVQGTDKAIKEKANFAETNASDADRVDVAARFHPTRIAAFIAVKKSYYTGL